VRRTVPDAVSVPGVAHVCIADVESESLLYLLDEADVCASAASACASGAMEPSHVLRAMGVEREWSAGALRLSMGHTTTQADVDRTVRVVAESVERIRAVAARLKRD
jgi:cysteine desulfurase